MKGELPHKPVLVEEFLKHCPSSWKSLCFLDGSFGRGGHTKVVLENFPKVVVTALDRDEEAIEFGKIFFKSYTKERRLSFYQAHWLSFSEELREESFDLVLLDLGVSSPQLDEAQRGFSFYKDGPLDMRMNQDQLCTAKDIINSYDVQKLMKLFLEKGEIFRPQKVAHAISKRRKEKKFKTTEELAHFIADIEGWRKKGHHPATKYFQALRLEVNQELEQLTSSLPYFFQALTDGGRFIVISFHSLEDRIVKTFFRQMENGNEGFRVNKKVLKPTEQEKKENPRARSAKMRVFQKGSRDLCH